MLLLALDTSTNYASIAVARDGQLLAELTWEVGQRHSAELFDRVAHLLDSVHMAPNLLNAIAVARGPGSFNGTRVAVTAAKTLAFALGIAIYGHATLDVIAWPYACGTVPIWALLDAGRGQVYAARYVPADSPDGWMPVEGYMVATPEELAARDDGPAVIAGEWREETVSALRRAFGARARFTPALALRRASSLAALAFARAASGEADDPLALEPLYLRKPAITRSAKVALPPYRDPAAPAEGGEDNVHALRR